MDRLQTIEAELAKALGEALRGEVRAFARVTSTMDVAHALAQEGAPEGTLVWAKRQEQGRGRLGRVWESPEGGIYCSVIMRPQRPAADIPQLSLLMGLAAAEAIRESAMISPRVRWPNDLLIGAHKIAGILSEGAGGGPAPAITRGGPGRRGTGKGDAYVVIGIGINVSTNPASLPPTATSLAAAGGKNLDPFHLTARLYRRFFRWYDVWTQEAFSPVREALRPHMGLFGEVVHIRAGSEEFEGTATDLDESGRLLVRLESGILKPFDVGEVTHLR